MSDEAGMMGVTESGGQKPSTPTELRILARGWRNAVKPTPGQRHQKSTNRNGIASEPVRPQAPLCLSPSRELLLGICYLREVPEQPLGWSGVLQFRFSNSFDAVFEIAAASQMAGINRLNLSRC